MIRLIAITDQGEATEIASAPYFRITGGAVWIGPGQAGETPLIRFAEDGWQHASSQWVGLRFEGKCRIVFGLPREPSAVSEVLQGLSISKRTLTASGIPFAEYNEQYDMWKGASANSWWHAFRVESAGQRDPTVASHEETMQPHGSRAESGSLEAGPRLH